MLNSVVNKTFAVVGLSLTLMTTTNAFAVERHQIKTGGDEVVHCQLNADIFARQSMIKKLGGGQSADGGPDIGTGCDMTNDSCQDDPKNPGGISSWRTSCLAQGGNPISLR